ncbi:MAG: hypothetical protein LBI26_02825 [Holosporales bacterium]|jgi:uridylate kinase|nr:hypothetical protein [Holosporales bacterium]
MKNNIKRILIKLSGEALSSGSISGVFDFPTIKKICTNVKNVLDNGVKVSIVVGGGNIVRGRELINGEVIKRRETADSVGMLATSVNGLLLAEMFYGLSVDTAVLAPISMPFGIGNSNAREIEENNEKLIIFVCGAGMPYFSTDTISVINAIRTKSDVLLKATNVDGVYNKDPKKHSDAIHIPSISYKRALQENITVMDRASFAIAEENDLPIMIFSIKEENCFLNVLNGDLKHSIIL